MVISPEEQSSHGSSVSGFTAESNRRYAVCSVECKENIHNISVPVGIVVNCECILTWLPCYERTGSISHIESVIECSHFNEIHNARL